MNPDAAGALNLPAGCTLTLREVGVTVDAWESTSVVPTPTGLRMQSGLAAFAVDRVAPGRPPVEIDVGATRVRVLGTRFVITNDDHGGHLDLIEGAVVLVRPSGLSEVEVGQRASWQHRAPEAAVPEPPSAPQLTAPSRTAPSRSAPSRSAPSSDDATRGALGDVLAELAQLRRRQRYVEALTVLDGFPRTSLDARTRAVLSYERGTLLEAAGRDDDACAHWAAHTARFVGVGPADAAQRRARLECPED